MKLKGKIITGAVIALIALGGYKAYGYLKPVDDTLLITTNKLIMKELQNMPIKNKCNFSTVIYEEEKAINITIILNEDGKISDEELSEIDKRYSSINKNMKVGIDVYDSNMTKIEEIK